MIKYNKYVKDVPCRNCGKIGDKYLEPNQLDHIRPKALFGSNEISNLQVLCQFCHGIKTNRDMILIRLLERELRNVKKQKADQIYYMAREFPRENKMNIDWLGEFYF
jgi:5-methylcytosine-specific restriction endonuclease McrA